MLFALNIGNSRISLGCIEGDKILARFRIGADINKTADEYAILFSQLLSLNNIDTKSIDGAVISSVVPTLTDVATSAVNRLFSVNPIIVGAGIRTGLKMRIENPAQLGPDLAVLAVGALEKYKSPLVVISMGTATTFTVIDDTSTLTGVSIAPGIGLSLSALSSMTSLLPQVKLNLPKSCIGTNTDECMRSGAVFGTASMIDGMIARIEETLGYNVTAIATGSYAELVTSVCKRQVTVDRDLILCGLSNIYNKNKKK